MSSANGGDEESGSIDIKELVKVVSKYATNGSDTENIIEPQASLTPLRISIPFTIP